MSTYSLEVFYAIRSAVDPIVVSDLFRDCLNLYYDFRAELGHSPDTAGVKAFDAFQIKFLAIILDSFGNLVSSLPNSVTETTAKMFDSLQSSVSR